MEKQGQDIRAEGDRSVAARDINAPVHSGDVYKNFIFNLFGKSAKRVRWEPPNKKFFQTCDRTPQVKEFEYGFKSHVTSKTTRPMIVLVHGHEEEEHDLILDRLEEDELPKLLKKDLDKPVCRDYLRQIPPPHTEPGGYWESLSGLDFFNSPETEVSSSDEEKVRTLVPSLQGHLLIKATYFTSEFRSAGSRSSFQAANPFGYFRRDRSIEPITDWLDKLTRFWREWPEIEGGKMVIFLVSLKNDSGVLLENEKIDRLKEWGKKYQERTDQALPTLLILSGLTPITAGDAKRWCEYLKEINKIKKIGREDPERLEEIERRVARIYDKPDLTLPMRRLIDKIKKIEVAV